MYKNKHKMHELYICNKYYKKILYYFQSQLYISNMYISGSIQTVQLVEHIFISCEYFGQYYI